MQRVVFLFVFLKLGRDCPSDMWGGVAIPHNKYRSSTLVGLRHPEMALQAAFRTGSIFEACDDLLQTGDAYSAEEKHRATTVVWIVLVSVPQLLVFANLLRMLFLTPVFALVLAMLSLYVSRVAPKTGPQPNVKFI